MPRLRLAILGLLLSALLLWLPARYLAAWTPSALGPSIGPLMLLPLAALAVVVVRPLPWATLAAFPVAHLPALLAAPELSGPRIHSGWSGAAALALLVGVGVAWVLAAASAAETVDRRPRLPEEASPDAADAAGADGGEADGGEADRSTGASTPGRALPGLATVGAATILAAFVLPVLEASEEARRSSGGMAAVAGLVIAAWVVGRWGIAELAAGWLNDGVRAPWRPSPSILRRASGRRCVWLLTAGALLGAVLLLLRGGAA